VLSIFLIFFTKRLTKVFKQRGYC